MAKKKPTKFTVTENPDLSEVAKVAKKYNLKGKVRKNGVVKPTQKYKLEIRVNDKVFKATGDDLSVMLAEINFPDFIKSETNIIASNKTKTLQRDLKVFQARRVFTGYDNTSMQLLGIALTKQLR